jgi:hypothetical protein
MPGGECKAVYWSCSRGEAELRFASFSAGLVAQSVEQRPFKPLVLGSSPSQPTSSLKSFTAVLQLLLPAALLPALSA